MMGILLVACASENAPTENSLKIQNSGTRSPVYEYEELYESIFSNELPKIMRMSAITELLENMAYGHFTARDTTYANIDSIVNDNINDIYDIFDEALQQCNIPINLETDTSWNSNVMEHFISGMLDSAYITPSYRYQIFANGDIGERERFSLCLWYAVNNKIYEMEHNYTIVVTDEQHNQYAILQLRDTTGFPFHWVTPCDIYEIQVNDIRSIDTTEILASITHNDGRYRSFISNAAREEYLSYMDSHYTIYYVTSQECEENRAAAMESLEMEISAVIIMSTAGGPDAVMVAATGCALYYLVKSSAIDIEYHDCLEEAEDE